MFMRGTTPQPKKLREIQGFWKDQTVNPSADCKACKGMGIGTKGELIAICGCITDKCATVGQLNRIRENLARWYTGGPQLPKTEKMKKEEDKKNATGSKPSA